ncbi:hypothetical protein DFH28DRAFT_1133930 [Melampsora americana]|nr:hypothetical protein DFH28DRAFT_1133930 [Melampsora americana]
MQPIHYHFSFMTQDVHIPGKVFPKSGNPYEVIAAKGWPIRLNLKQPESLLLPEELALGFRDCNDALKKKWLTDIQNGHFTIEKIPASEMITMKRQHKNKSSKKQISKSTQPAASSPVNTQQQTQIQGTQTTQTHKNKSKKSKKLKKSVIQDYDESSEHETPSETDPEESEPEESEPGE